MSELKSLNDIFKSSIFRIPDYQRGYSWEKQQLEEFWEDVINLPDNSEHYAGLISLQELTWDENKEDLDKWEDSKWLLNKDYHCYHVVDGQQRLTTIIILIQTIIEIYREKNNNLKDSEIILNDTLLTEIIEQYIVKVKPGSDNIIITYLLGYEVDKPSDDYLKNKILNPNYEGEINESFYTVNLDNAKAFFTNKLNEIYAKDNRNTDKNFSGIENIYRKITNKLKFNLHKIEKGFNINVAFETMNNRGKRLSNLELLKNRLIYLSTLLELPKDEEKTLIADINETWKTIYSYLGKNKNRVLEDDDFLIAHSYVYFGYIEDVKKSYSQFLLKKYFNQNRIRQEIREEIVIDFDKKEENSEIIEEVYDNVDLSKKLGKKDIIEYIRSLKKLIPYWYMIYFNGYNTKTDYCKEINNWLKRLDRLEYNYFKALVLVVLSKNNINDEMKCKILKYIERFIFVNFRLDGYQATYSRNIYYKITHELYLDLIEPEEIIEELKDISQLSVNNVIDLNLGTLSTINKLFKNSGFYSWKTIKYFLYEYEMYLVNKLNGVVKTIDVDYFNSSKKADSVSIEHIFPQSENSEYWVKQFDKKYDLNKRNRLRGSLGNLIPLSLSINRKLQDDDFAVKMERYKIGSYSEMEICDFAQKNRNNIIWNEESILKRGMKLIEFIEERWEFKFANDADRKKFLGLDFMIEKGDINKNINAIISKENNYIREEYPDLEELLHLSMDNTQYATGYYKNNGIVVNKGSKLRLNVKATTEVMQNKVERERQNKNIQDYKYIKDVYYESPSLAANVILGNNKNGWICWRNSEGRTLDEILRRKNKRFNNILRNKSDQILEIYNILNDKLLNIDEQIYAKPDKNYIAYGVKKIFLEVHIRKDKLLCYTVNGELYKSNKDVEHVPESYNWKVDTSFYITSIQDIDKYWKVIVDSYENTL